MKLLCPTDFSKAASEAADVAAALAARQKLPLEVVYCAADWVVSAEVPVVDPHDQGAPERLEAEAYRLGGTAAGVTSTMLMGSVHREIVAAAQQDTQMIVMGSTGKGAAERWLIGSEAVRVAESAPVPTLVVRNAAPLLAWLKGEKPLHVLCAVEFSTAGDAAIAAVKQLMGIGSVELEAAHIVRVDIAPMEDMLITGEPTPQELTKLQQDVWERLREALDPKSVKVHVRSAFGDPAFELVRLADEARADLIVAGAHQRHGLKRLAAPSFSRSVLHHAAANVLCVPVCSYKPEFHAPAVRRALVATDLSPAGDSAIARGCSMLASGGSLQILHVAPPPKSGLDPLVAARVYFSHSLESSEANEALEEALLARIPRQFSTAGIAITSRVVEHDDVAAAICESAEKFGADVICMASRGHSPLVSAIIGSVAQGVLGRSHRPVLVVPPPVA